MNNAKELEKIVLASEDNYIKDRQKYLDDHLTCAINEILANRDQFINLANVGRPLSYRCLEYPSFERNFKNYFLKYKVPVQIKEELKKNGFNVCIMRAPRRSKEELPSYCYRRTSYIVAVIWGPRQKLKEFIKNIFSVELVSFIGDFPNAKPPEAKYYIKRPVDNKIIEEVKKEPKKEEVKKDRFSLRNFLIFRDAI